MKILFASNNRGKFGELEKDFKEVGIDLIFKSEIIGDNKLDLPEPSENSLMKNAELKAISAAKQTGMISIGDDSGVFIEELDYRPGVFSRRWLTHLEDGTEVPEGADGDMMRNMEILRMLKGLPAERRLAHLISRFAIATPDGEIIGRTFSKNTFYIAEEPKTGGNGSFGYDPILIKKPTREDGEQQYSKECEYLANNITIGCLTQEEKNFVNARAIQIRDDVKKSLEEYENRGE